MHPIVLVFALVLASCATTTSNTASGKPEVTVSGKVSAVKGYITSEMLNRGYQPHSSNDSLIVFQKLAPMNAGTGWLTASLGPITVRTQFTIVELGGSVRVVGSPTMVQWADSPREAPVAGAFTAPQAAVDDLNAVLAGVRQKFGA